MKKDDESEVKIYRKFYSVAVDSAENGCNSSVWCYDSR